jgi:hypothetical protein
MLGPVFIRVQGFEMDFFSLTFVMTMHLFKSGKLVGGWDL